MTVDQEESLVTNEGYHWSCVKVRKSNRKSRDVEVGNGEVRNEK